MPLPHDTPVKIRHTSSFHYKYDLASARNAVLHDLEHVPEVDFDQMTTALLPSVPEPLVTAIRNRLRKEMLLDDHGRWTTFLSEDPSGTPAMSEKTMFQPLEPISLAILDEVALYQGRSEPLLTYVDDEAHTLFSHRMGSSRPDAYLRLKQSTIPGRHAGQRTAWADVGVSFEFKRGQSDADVFDVRSDLAPWA